MSYPNPHLRPGHPGYRPPPPSGSNTVLKTCLIIAGVLGGIGIVIALICGFSGWFIFNSAVEVAEQQQKRADEVREAREEARRPPDDPESVDEAIQYLNRSEDKYHLAAANWLAAQPANRAFQGRVNKALAALLKSSPQQTKQSALQALAMWGDETVAGDVAITLRPNDSLNREKLVLLGRWKQKIGAKEIAELLSSKADASSAADALQAIGPDAAPFVASQLSKGGVATEHARKLLEGWEIDTSKALIQLYAEHLRTDNLIERREAVKELKTLPFDASLQDDVVDAIVNSKADGFELREMLGVIEKWGNKECLPLLHTYIRDESFGFEAALSAAANIGDPASLPVMAETLTKHAQNNDQVINAFVQFGEPAIDEVLRYVNHENQTARNRAREIIQRLNAPTDRILDQCIEDLSSTNDARLKAAVEFVESLDVVEAKQSEVAAALGKTIDDLNVFDKRELAKALARWATGDEVEYLMQLFEEHDKEVWLPAFKSALKLNKPEEMKLATAELLGSFSKREAARDAMIECGQPCEELAILMLGHNDVDVVIEMVKLLGNVGTEPSVDALSRVARAAQKQRAKNIEDMADDAKRAVQARLRANESDGDDSGQDD